MQPAVSSGPTVTLPRPKSFSSLSTGSITPSNRNAPYMVALSGWPEPVYVAGPSLGSRPGTPGPSDHSEGPGEMRDGISPSLARRRKSEDVFPKTKALSMSRGSSQDRHVIGRSSPAPTGSIFSQPCMYQTDPSKPCPIPDHPNHFAKYTNQYHHTQPFKSSGLVNSTSRADSPSAFPTSSARSTPHPSPPTSRRGSPKPRHSLLSSIPIQGSENMEEDHFGDSEDNRGQRERSFKDPRFAPNVAVLANRPALPLAPNWTSSANTTGSTGQTGASTPSSRTNTQHTGYGVAVSAGQRGTGILVMRAVPDVYPPPVPAPGMAGMVTGMTRSGSHGKAKRGKGAGAGGGFEMATEVYPRDPDSAFLWGSGAAPQHQADALMEDSKDNMDLDGN